MNTRKRLLVVQQFTGERAPTDRLHGTMTRDALRGHGWEPTYIGRRIVTGAWHRPGDSRITSLVRPTLPYKAAVRGIDALAIATNEQRALRHAQKADAVHLLKMDRPRFFKRLRKTTGARLVYNLGDAMWTPESRAIYPGLDQMIQSADAVTCDTYQGLDWARNLNPNVFLLPPPSQVELFDACVADHTLPQRGQVTIGWIGSEGTAEYLRPLVPALERTAARYPDLRFRFVGIGPDHDVVKALGRRRATARPDYDQAAMIEEVLGFDIGLHPIPATVAGIMHGTLKALIYMAGRAVPIATSLGDIPTVIRHRHNGYLASDANGWQAALDDLVADPDRRARISTHALAFVRSHRSFSTYGAAVARAMDPAASPVAIPERYRWASMPVDAEGNPAESPPRPSRRSLPQPPTRPNTVTRT